LIVSGELDVSDVLRVASVGAWLVSLADWISEESDETEVITAGNKLVIRRAGNGVDVGTISSSWEDTFDVPAELDSAGSPLNSDSV